MGRRYDDSIASGVTNVSPRAFASIWRFYADGTPGDYYIDGKQTTLRSRGAYLVAQLILDDLKGTGVDAIGGPTMGLTR